MRHDQYIKWKQWDYVSFGVPSAGTKFCVQRELGVLLRDKVSILEVGFGQGELLGFFRESGRNVIGLEKNPNLVRLACEHGFSAFEGDPWDIPQMSAKQFDLIIAMSVVEHMEFDDLARFFSWSRAHLTESGILYLKFPEGSSPFGLGYQNGDFTHRNCMTKGKIIALCSMSEMSLISYHDEELVSNRLCSYGALGKLLLIALQFYAALVKRLIKLFFFPVCPGLSLATNSISIIVPKRDLERDSSL